MQVQEGQSAEQEVTMPRNSVGSGHTLKIELRLASVVCPYSDCFTHGYFHIPRC